MTNKVLVKVKGGTSDRCSNVSFETVIISSVTGVEQLLDWGTYLSRLVTMVVRNVDMMMQNV